MDTLVALQCVAPGKVLGTDVALVGFLAGVCALVQLKVLALGELFEADVTVEWFLASVRPRVHLQ